MTRATAALLIAGGLAGCRAPAPPAPASAASEAALVITLERRPCYGTCPFYRMTIRGDGELRYEGIRFVTREGTLVERVPAERVRALAEAFRAARFDQLADRYTRGEPTCPLYAADAPTVITSLTTGGATKRVEHDHGCAGVPDALTALEDRIDEAVESWRWTTGREP